MGTNTKKAGSPVESESSEARSGPAAQEKLCLNEFNREFGSQLRRKADAALRRRRNWSIDAAFDLAYVALLVMIAVASAASLLASGWR